jgi:hypothetical protein
VDHRRRRRDAKNSVRLVKLIMKNVLTIMTGLFLSVGTTVTEAAEAPTFDHGPARISTAPDVPQLSAFYLRAFAGNLVRAKCLDFGASPQMAGSPVFVYDCNDTASQEVVVEEISDRHEVILHAGTKVIGIHNPQVSTIEGAAPVAAAPAEFTLELQDRASPLRRNSADQRFALDGDSIILASSRSCVHSATSVCPPQLVIQVQNARGANRSPLVVGPRNLADSEFWDFKAADGSDKDPTSGFRRVATTADLLSAMGQINQFAQQHDGTAWGQVVKIIDTSNPIDLTANPACGDGSGCNPNLVLPTGMTIRGDRRGTLLGPQLLGLYRTGGMHMMEIQGDYVRITGLRLQGPTTATDTAIPSVDAVLVPAPYNPVGLLIDHNDISAWTNAAVEVYGQGGVMKGGPGDPSLICPEPDASRNGRVRIERNFIHHNDENTGNGYGIVVSDGGAATISGNTFLMNRHSIAGDGDVRDQYSAWFNLILSRAPVYFSDWGFKSAVEQTFDMHGGIGGNAGFAGSEVDIAWNSFLASSSINFELRGPPCNLVNGVTAAFSDTFHNNVSTRNQDKAIEIIDGNGQSRYVTTSTSSVRIDDNQFVDNVARYSDPTVRLGVGNFDGDGVQDLFLATGAAWYYSAGGVTEWRYLNGGKTDRVDSLLLGDFDGDGRTDVIGKNGDDVMISWGGVSDWQKINMVSAPITDLAVGDFDGDGRADLFWADGNTWRVSSGAAGPFTPVQTSSFRVKDLRFGHFSVCDSEGVTTTDVFGIEGGKWHVSCGAKSSWTPLPVSLTNHIDGLVLADFDGNGHSDIVAFANPFVTISGIASGAVSVTDWHWAISRDGAQGWVDHHLLPPTNGGEPCLLQFDSYRLPLLPLQPQQPISVPASSLLVGVGRFSGNSGADILLWGSTFGNNTCIVAGGSGAVQRRSRQDMR